MKIAFGTDLSEESYAAARWASQLDSCQDASDLDGIFVVSRGYPEQSQELLTDTDNRVRLQTTLSEKLKPFAGECDIVLREGSPLHELQEASKDCDILVVGSTPEGVGLWAMGSVAERICHKPSATTVIVRPDRPLGDAPKWVVGVDFSPASMHAIQEAITLAKITGATLHFVHVLSAPSPVVVADANLLPVELDTLALHTANDQLRVRMDELVESLQPALEGLSYTHEVRVGYPLLSLIDSIDEKQADAVVVGSVGRSWLGDFIMGSVTNGLVKRMPTTVIVTAA